MGKMKKKERRQKYNELFQHRTFLIPHFNHSAYTYITLDHYPAAIRKYTRVSASIQRLPSMVRKLKTACSPTTKFCIFQHISYLVFVLYKFQTIPSLLESLSRVYSIIHSYLVSLSLSWSLYMIPLCRYGYVLVYDYYSLLVYYFNLSKNASSPKIYVTRLAKIYTRITYTHTYQAMIQLLLCTGLPQSEKAAISQLLWLVYV